MEEESMNKDQKLLDWCGEYEKIAKARGMEWMYTGDPRDYEDSYEWFDPMEHFEEDLAVLAAEA